MMRPPHRLDVSQKTFLGFTWRQIAIAALTGVAALLAFIYLPFLPLFGRAALAVLLAGLGLAWAFGEIDQQTPEAWLLDVVLFRRRSRHWMHRMLSEEADPRRATWPEESRATSASSASADEAGSVGPGFFWLSANAIGVALLTGLTLWLWQGGAAALARLWRGL